ncbi:hypothetical protein FX988_03521 [Paraglaciecola mesophila]|uniref:Metalloenzyme domain-containing protein n=1 Tax=Paraglaciecola mesophila TaxID=197222 RepID=A0A857JQ33_9ALTE|nr:alkaline phosphatase family protein [Paraglaciecola mesophila]QHJ13260.1 hypothetical protein FX988_03521 [Paraglaciecola mesophila]
MNQIKRIIRVKPLIILCQTLWIILLAAPVSAADNLLIISIDGLRWQEVFRGYDANLLAKPEFAEQAESIRHDLGAKTADEKRHKLMPFLWRVIAKQGLLIGNRDKQSAMEVSNTWWFSYPGYNEILTGKADERVDSNKPIANPNVTILEWLNQQEKFQHNLAAFGSWDVFPAIINQERSKLPINAGFMSADWSELTDKAKWLNELQKDIPSPWHNVRLDAFTVGFAQEYIQVKQPSVIYVALGETDDFAHDGDYPAYLRSARLSDVFIKRLWDMLQAMPKYKGNTNLLITVDHGRGNSIETWQHHASPKATQGYLSDLAEHKHGIKGSNQVWMAAMGPDIQPSGEVSNSETYRLNQIAATALILLGQNPSEYAKMNGKPIGEALPIIKP